MVLLPKKSLPASMDKSTLPEVLLLKLQEEGNCIPVIPVALLGRDSDGHGVLFFADSDGSLQVKQTYKEDSQSLTGGAQSSTSIDISNYTIGSIEVDVTGISDGGSAQVQVSNDDTNWTNGTTTVITIGTSPNTYYEEISDEDMKYKYLRVNYTGVTDMTCTQITIAKR